MASWSPAGAAGVKEAGGRGAGQGDGRDRCSATVVLGGGVAWDWEERGRGDRDRAEGSAPLSPSEWRRQEENEGERGDRAERG